MSQVSSNQKTNMKNLRTTNYPLHAKSPLINDPSKQGDAQRCVFLGLTILIWVLWLSLWTPLILPALLLFGIFDAGILSPLRMGASSLFVLFCIMTGCFLFTIAWVAGKKRLRRPEFQRKHPQEICEDHIQNPDGLDSESARNLSFASRAKIYFNKIGKPVKVLISGKR